MLQLFWFWINSFGNSFKCFRIDSYKVEKRCFVINRDMQHFFLEITPLFAVSMVTKSSCWVCQWWQTWECSLCRLIRPNHRKKNRHSLTVHCTGTCNIVYECIALCYSMLHYVARCIITNIITHAKIEAPCLSMTVCCRWTDYINEVFIWTRETFKKTFATMMVKRFCVCPLSLWVFPPLLLLFIQP